MQAFFEAFGGIGLAFLGASLAVGLCCVGSAKGTGMVGEAATGVLCQAPEHFSKCLILHRCVAWIEEQIKLDLKKTVKVQAIRKKPYFQDT